MYVKLSINWFACTILFSLLVGVIVGQISVWEHLQMMHNIPKNVPQKNWRITWDKGREYNVYRKSKK